MITFRIRPVSLAVAAWLLGVYMERNRHHFPDKQTRDKLKNSQLP